MCANRNPSSESARPGMGSVLRVTWTVDVGRQMDPVQWKNPRLLIGIAPDHRFS